MKRAILWTTVLAVGLAGSAPSEAAAPEAPPALAHLPETVVGFFHVPDVAALERGMLRFAERTGWDLGAGEHPLMDLIGRRTGVRDGLDPEGSLCIGFVDPKRYRRRYTIYVLPVADWDTLLASTRGEMMSPGLYALTGTAGPRFVRRRGRYAVVTSSIRTMDALAERGSLAAALHADTRARAASGGPLLCINVHRLKEIYEPEIASWFRASSGKVYDQPHALPYADMLVTYMLGIASLIDQIETIEIAPRFEPEGLAADLAIRFADGGSVAEFLSAQKPGRTAVPVITDRPVASAVTVRVDREKRTDLAVRATRFFVEKAPRPEPLPESTKETVEQAVRVFVESLGETMTFLSAPAKPGMGLEASVSIYDLVDAEQFEKSITLLVDAWERLADQLRLYLKFRADPEPEQIAGVPITVYRPRLRFGIPARHIRFRKRLRRLFGPEGLVYRVAIVGDRAVVATGSDLTLLRKVIRRLKAGEAPEPSPALRRLQTHVSPDQNIYIATSLPVYLGASLARGGTPTDQIGTVDPGHERVGVGIRFRGTTAQLTTYWPHEQIRMARDLIGRVAPEVEKVPESLFPPEPEGPPEIEAPPEGEGEAEPEGGAAPAPAP